MAFKDAIEYLKEYYKTSADNAEDLKRPTWSLTEAGDLYSLIELFDSSAENEAWQKLDEEGADINQLMGVRGKIAWMGGCRRDLRRQYISGEADPRTALERRRYGVGQRRFREQVLAQLEQTLDKNRAEPVTKKKQ